MTKAIGQDDLTYLWLAMFLQPAEDAGREFREVGDTHSAVERMEEGVHDGLELSNNRIS